MIKMAKMGYTVNLFKANLLLSLLFLLVFNMPIGVHFYRILSGMESVHWSFVLSLPIVLFSALYLIFISLSHRYLFKPLFVALILSASAASYAMLTYGIVLDSGMVQNILETHHAEVTAYFNGKALAWFFFTGILPALWLSTTRIVYPHSLRKEYLFRLGGICLSATGLALMAWLFYKDYASVGRNNHILVKEIVPSNYVVGLFKYLKNHVFASPLPHRLQGTDAVIVHRSGRGEKPTLLFLVIGETARAQSMALNGYPRDTNPVTGAIDGVFSFQHTTACGTATAVSLPCLFSNLGQAHYDERTARFQDNLLDVLGHAKVALFWKSNADTCKGACARVPYWKVAHEPYPALCQQGSCYDEVLLEGLDQEIASMPKGHRMVIFHLTGSHGPDYYRRYPASDRFFTPDCPRSDMENCSAEALVNTYDNTIRYTDKVIGRLIEKLQSLTADHQVALMYLSDHGESLGENGLYLHGIPYKLAPAEQTHVPWLVWFSPQWRAAGELDTDCLAAEAHRGPFSHDNLFHSVLGVMDVQSSVYQPALDVFKPCRPLS